MEVKFGLVGVTTDSTKFYYALVGLDKESVAFVW